MTKPKNPTAFPINDRMTAQNGMTLRDYFAAKAMEGLIIRNDIGAFDFVKFPSDPERFGLWAYDIADALLKARETP